MFYEVPVFFFVTCLKYKVIAVAATKTKPTVVSTLEYLQKYKIYIYIYIYDIYMIYIYIYDMIYISYIMRYIIYISIYVYIYIYIFKILTGKTNDL